MKKITNKKFLKKKFYRLSIKKMFSVHSIKMPNISQNNGIENISKEISLLQDRLR